MVTVGCCGPSAKGLKSFVIGVRCLSWVGLTLLLGLVLGLGGLRLRLSLGRLRLLPGLLALLRGPVGFRPRALRFARGSAMGLAGSAALQFLENRAVGGGDLPAHPGDPGVA